MSGKLKCGVGVNDANYKVTKKERVGGKWKMTWVCPYYRTWSDMITRCYNLKYLARFPTYIGAKVCDEWLTFSNFRAWMVEQEWEDENGKRLQLDKDILSGGNRGKLYSPNTCLFISSKLNNFLLYEQSSNSGLPAGVDWREDVGKYRSQIGSPFTGKREHLGLFNTPEEAFVAYCKRKKELATEYAELVTDSRLKQVLLNFSVVVKDSTT